MPRPRRILHNSLTLLSLLFCLALLYVWFRGHRSPAPTRPSTDATQKLLARRLPEVRFDAVALTDVIDFFRDLTGQSFFVDWAALEASGIDKAAPVTYRWKSQRLGQALARTLDNAYFDRLPGDSERLVFAIDDGVIRISTRGALARPDRPSIPPKTPKERLDDAWTTWLLSGWKGPAPTAVPPPSPPPAKPPECILFNRRLTLSPHRGKLHLWLTPADPATPYQDGTPLPTDSAPDERILFDRLGFSLIRGRAPLNSWGVTTPIWPLVVITAILPLKRFISHLRRPRPGHCPECNYDLRATPNRCPECGHSS